MLRKENKKLMFCWSAFLFLASVFRIVISSGYTYEYMVGAGMDDQWMIERAYYILGGQWLGPYSHLTLIKSVTYPFMLAFFRVIGMPYGMGIGLFIAAVSFVFAKAIKPEEKNDFLRGIIYLAILYSPFGFLSITSARIYRNSVSHWMALLVIASIIGIYYRKDYSLKKLWKWILCESVSFMMFWELREDHIWILAFVVPASIIILIYRIGQKKGIIKSLFGVFVPFVSVIIMELSIATINYKYYGIFTVNDRAGTYCAKVISLLYKIDDGKENDQRVWVSKDALLLAREASPTLDSIGEYLDVDWYCMLVITTESGYEVPGDHAEWALRMAVMDAGYYKDAVSTNEFYKKIYEELEDGFDSGKLKKKKGLFLSSQMRPFNNSDMETAWKLTGKVVIKYSNYDANGVYVGYSTYGMDENDKSYFENMLLTKITEQNINEDEEVKDYGEYATAVYNRFIRGILDVIWKIYKRLAVFLNYISIGAFIFMIVSMIFELKRKEFYSFYTFLLTGGIILLLYAYTFMICLWGLWMTTDVNSPVYWFYGSSGPMLVQLWRILCLTYLVNRITMIYRNNKRASERIVDEETEKNDEVALLKNLKCESGEG